MRRKKLKVLHKLFDALVKADAEPIGLSQELSDVEDHATMHGYRITDGPNLMCAFAWGHSPQGADYWAHASCAYQ